MALNQNQTQRGIYAMNGAKTIEELQSRMDRYCLICSMGNNAADDCEGCPVNRFFNQMVKRLEKRDVWRVAYRAKG